MYVSLGHKDMGASPQVFQCLRLRKARVWGDVSGLESLRWTWAWIVGIVQAGAKRNLGTTWARAEGLLGGSKSPRGCWAHVTPPARALGAVTDRQCTKCGTPAGVTHTGTRSVSLV